MSKPLQQKAYGSILHLPNSRMGSGEYCVNAGQAKICTEKVRNKLDRVIVTEKLDGSCVSVALLDNKIIPLMRAGYLATSSPYKQHHLFVDWVTQNEDRFRSVLREGERIVGEWLALAHGTIYKIEKDPFGVFDIMKKHTRIPYDELVQRTDGIFERPNLIHDGKSISVDDAMAIHETKKWNCDETEGVVYRVEKNNKVLFLAKFVKHNKIDGKYLPEFNDGKEIWNWNPINKV